MKVIEINKDGWLNAFIKQGHIPILNEWDEPDIFALDSEPHNGPQCLICNYTACMMCVKPDKILKCKGF